MCVYCMVGDEFFKDQNPPVWPKPMAPFVPDPVTPPPHDYVGWDVEKLKELLAILQQIKTLEDALKCPCVPAKADYIKILKDRIQALEDGLAICPACKRWWAKPADKSHTRVQCLKLQLEDAEAEQKAKVSA